MKAVSIGKIAEVTGGRIMQGDPDTILHSVSTDTRKIKQGDLFFALTGEHYDAHDFLAQAAAAGSGGLVVGRRVSLPAGVPVLLVEDTLAALQALAAFNRERFQGPMVGITGSTGKTTTKDMVASVLGVRWRTLKTEGNLNNEIGLPLTLLALDDGVEACTVEMAMRGPGEIAALSRIARPGSAVITNINETHLERLGTVSRIAAAKGELLEHVPPGGFALLNVESPFIKREAKRCRGKVIYYGLEKPTGLMAREIRPERGGLCFNVVLEGELQEFYLPVPGRHNVLNALAAIGVGRELGLTVEEIAAGLAAVALSGMRLEILEAGGLTIINDAYNASPASTRAALEVLRDVSGGRRKIAVLGNMLELGPCAVEIHREIGKKACELGLDFLITVGNLAAGAAEGAVQAGMAWERVFPCTEHAVALRILKGLLHAGDVVLVKGSRGVKMEVVVQGLLKQRAENSKAISPT
jgi:UDP-N-acetylmuramoyl-tripeptide--D-alanyl-D-alanine ligase